MAAGFWKIGIIAAWKERFDFYLRRAKNDANYGYDEYSKECDLQTLETHKDEITGMKCPECGNVREDGKAHDDNQPSSVEELGFCCAACGMVWESGMYFE